MELRRNVVYTSLPIAAIWWGVSAVTAIPLAVADPDTSSAESTTNEPSATTPPSRSAGTSTSPSTAGVETRGRPASRDSAESASETPKPGARTTEHELRRAQRASESAADVKNSAETNVEREPSSQTAIPPTPDRADQIEAHDGAPATVQETSPVTRNEATGRPSLPPTAQRQGRNRGARNDTAAAAPLSPTVVQPTAVSPPATHAVEGPVSSSSGSTPSLASATVLDHVAAAVQSVVAIAAHTGEAPAPDIVVPAATSLHPLGVLPTNAPDAPVESAAMWTALAFTRRQLGPTAIEPMQTVALTSTSAPLSVEATPNALAAARVQQAAEAVSTPYLPIDMSVAPTEKVVLAHYVPWLPISLDNLPADQDYYTAQFLNPLGENGTHAAYGGYLRDRPLPRDPIDSPDWQLEDLTSEVNQAKSVGIDGFAVDIVAPSSQNAQISDIYTAAAGVGGFVVQPVADMSGPMGSATSEEFAAQFAPYLSASSTQRLDDGRAVLGAFYAEARPALWWNDTMTVFRDDYDLNVAFVPTFLDAYNNMDAFAPFSYGFGNWGGRNAVNTDPQSTFPGTQASMIEKAHSLGKVWMQPVAFQDNRPREGIYEESGNSTVNTNDWDLADQYDAEWVQLVTWNDYAEGTAMAPSVDHGYRLLDQQAYFIDEFKHDTEPTVVRDAVYVSHRTQFAHAESTYDETLPMQLRPGTPAATDNVEVVTYTTAPATVFASIGGVVSSCDVGAGRSTCTFPLRAGDVIIGLQRNGTWQTIVQSPYPVTATPFTQDLEYHIAGGLR